MGEKSRVARVPQPKPPAIFLCAHLLRFSDTNYLTKPKQIIS